MAKTRLIWMLQGASIAAVFLAGYGVAMSARNTELLNEAAAVRADCRLALTPN